MLVLSRKRLERISLVVPPSDRSRTIELIVVEIDRDRVKVGFAADRDVQILREELIDKPRQRTA